MKIASLLLGGNALVMYKTMPFRCRLRWANNEHDEDVDKDEDEDEDEENDNEEDNEERMMR